ncbi:MAG: DUF1576 domain-containing protein [Lachnospiraceae bacterium]|nr:MAG: DUF1576 domain-containing protein [Lachnospiraceae bacterium]
MKKIIENLSGLLSGKNHLKKDSQYIVLEILPITMLIMSFFYNSPWEIIKGLSTIVRANDVFATDYTHIASVGSALFNSGLVVLINIYILRKMDLKLNGMIVSALFLLCGFSFVGKNIYNIWPFYIGGYVYSKVHKLDFKNTIVNSIYTTSLAPVISVVAYTFSANSIAAVILSYLCGAFIGYIMPELAARMLTAHAGYNLYNTGFAAGFVAITANSLFNMFGMPVDPKNIVSPDFNMPLLVLFTIYFLVLIILGYEHNNKSFEGYGKLMSYSGKLITDYTRLCGFPVTMVNMGVTGLIALAYVILMDGSFNGPTIAALLTLVGFSSCGNHPRNTISILIGVAVASKLVNINMTTTAIVISGLFGTTLAPIVGDFGLVCGFFLGPLHLALVSNIGSLHSGLNLYNNGLSGGIIAMLVVPILDAFSFKEIK